MNFRLMSISVTMAVILCIGLVPLADADITSNLVGHWTMDDGSGETAVDSAGDHNGTLITPPDPQFIPSGRLDGAIDFAGRPSGEVDSYVDCGDGGTLDITGDRTLSTWVKIDAWAEGTSGHWTGVITKGDVAGNYDLIRERATDHVGFYIADQDFVVGDDNVADGAWHLLTGVYDDAGTMSMYVDGQLDASISVTGGATVTNDQPLLFNALQDGKTGWDSNRWFDGQMDDVRLYNRALSASDVLELFNAAPDPRIPGDANEDGLVDVADLGILATNYDAGSGFGWGDADFNGDSLVDVADLGILATNYGLGTAAVPEPAMLSSLLLGLVLFSTARRR